jgi:hypothetical protein
MSRRFLALLALTALVSLFVYGCSAKADHAQTRELTEHQRDSVLSTENLPGTFAIKRAFAVSNKATNSAEQTNANVDSLFK